jgi:hypothetical protein
MQRRTHAYIYSGQKAFVAEDEGALQMISLQPH